MDWLFQESPNTAVFTSKEVIDDHADICLVYHDDDGSWQFHSANGAPDRIECARVVSMSTIMRLDESIADLHDLPLGWRAWRSGPTDPWKRERIG